MPKQYGLPILSGHLWPCKPYESTQTAQEHCNASHLNPVLCLPPCCASENGPELRASTISPPLGARTHRVQHQLGHDAVELHIPRHYLHHCLPVLQERGNDNARFWYNRISDFLPSNAWTRIGLRQMSGLLLLVYARNEIQVAVSPPPIPFSSKRLSVIAHCGLVCLLENVIACAASLLCSRYHQVSCCHRHLPLLIIKGDHPSCHTCLAVSRVQGLEILNPWQSAEVLNLLEALIAILCISDDNLSLRNSVEIRDDRGSSGLQLVET